MAQGQNRILHLSIPIQSGPYSIVGALGGIPLSDDIIRPNLRAFIFLPLIFAICHSVIRKWRHSEEPYQN